MPMNPEDIVSKNIRLFSKNLDALRFELKRAGASDSLFSVASLDNMTAYDLLETLARNDIHLETVRYHANQDTVLD